MKGKRCDGAQPAWGGARRQNSRSSNQARHCSHSAEPCVTEYPFLFFMLSKKRKIAIGRLPMRARVTQSDITENSLRTIIAGHHNVIEITW